MVFQSFYKLSGLPVDVLDVTIPGVHATNGGYVGIHRSNKAGTATSGGVGTTARRSAIVATATATFIVALDGIATGTKEAVCVGVVG